MILARCRSMPLRALIFQVLAAFLIAAPLTAEDKLQQRVAEFLGQPHFKTAHIGLLFVDLETGEVILERSSEKLFAPASTTKLYSTAAALDALGADYRFQTPIHRRGSVNEAGELDGD